MGAIKGVERILVHRSLQVSLTLLGESVELNGGVLVRLADSAKDSEGGSVDLKHLAFLKLVVVG